MEQILVIDISHWQGRLNMQKLKNFGVSAVIAKAGQWYRDAEYDDDKFDYSMTELEKIGMLHGMYYFYHPGVGNSKQLRHFSRLWNSRRQDFPAFLDCEAHDGLPPAEVDRQTKVMLEGMADITGRQPVIYTSPGYWNSRAYNPDWSNEYAFWVAQYPKLESKLFKNVILHQFTDKGKIPGCPTLDMNYWLAGEETFREYTQTAITPERVAENRIKKNIFALSRANRDWIEKNIGL